MTTLSLVPAYGRDYRSKAACLADWYDRKDFRSVGYPGTGYVSINDIHPGEKVTIRYDRLRKQLIVDGTPRLHDPIKPAPISDDATIEARVRVSAAEEAQGWPKTYPADEPATVADTWKRDLQSLRARVRSARNAPRYRKICFHRAGIDDGADGSEGFVRRGGIRSGRLAVHRKPENAYVGTSHQWHVSHVESGLGFAWRFRTRADALRFVQGLECHGVIGAWLEVALPDTGKVTRNVYTACSAIAADQGGVR